MSRPPTVLFKLAHADAAGQQLSPGKQRQVALETSPAYAWVAKRKNVTRSSIISQITQGIQKPSDKAPRKQVPQGIEDVDRVLYV